MYTLLVFGFNRDREVHSLCMATPKPFLQTLYDHTQQLFSDFAKEKLDVRNLEPSPCVSNQQHFKSLPLGELVESYVLEFNNYYTGSIQVNLAYRQLVFTQSLLALLTQFPEHLICAQDNQKPAYQEEIQRSRDEHCKIHL